MADRKRINPPGLAPAPYDYAAVVARGALVFTAGVCPLDEHGNVVALGDLEAQTAQALDNLEAALLAAGTGLADVLKTTVYVVTSDQARLVRAWHVAVLGYTAQVVEIEAVALVPDAA